LSASPRDATRQTFDRVKAAILRRPSAPLREYVPDLLAGASVAVVLIPQSLAYAQLAGMPAYRGLFAAAIPPLVAAPFTSSRYLQPGPTAVSALLTYAALSPLAPIGSGRYVELGLLLALLVGVIRIAVGLLRAGMLAHLMSQPLLVGFVPGAAILIIASQLPVALGAEARGTNELYRAGWALAHTGDWHVEAIAIAALASLLLVLGRRVHPLFPAVLLVVIAAALYSKLAGYGAATVGTTDASFPPLTTSLPLGDLLRLIVPALVIALIGFVEATSIARTYAALQRERWDPNREFISQGAANVGAGMLGGFPVGASFSRSALNRLAGAKTSLSGVVTGLVVFLFLPLGFLLGPLPRSVLAAIVIVSVAELVRPLPLFRLSRLSKPQFLVASTTLVLTVALAPHVERAVLVGIGLTVAVHLWRELSLDVPSWTEEDALHLRPRGVLWFGTAARLEDTFLRLIGEHREVQQLIVHLDGLGRIDTTGALALRNVLDEARAAGLAVEIVEIPTRWRRLVTHVIATEEDPLAEPRLRAPPR
jgi:sulfate permease, SulP family